MGFYTKIDEKYRNKLEFTIPEMTALLAGHCPSILILDSTLVSEEDKDSYDSAMAAVKYWREFLKSEIERDYRFWGSVGARLPIDVLSLRFKFIVNPPNGDVFDPDSEHIFDFEKCAAAREDFILYLRDVVGLKNVPLNVKELFDMIPNPGKSTADDFKDAPIVTGGNIHDYCMNEGITHPYFNPETVTPDPKPEPKPDTPADAAPETVAQNDTDEPQKQQIKRVRRTPDLNIDLGNKLKLDPVIYAVLSTLPQRDKEIMMTKLEYKAKNKDVAVFHGVGNSRVSQAKKAFDDAVKTLPRPQQELVARAITSKK